MAIVKRIQLGSSVRRVQPPKPIPGVDPVVAYEHLYHEIIYVVPGGPENGLPADEPGLPEVGVPSFPDASLPGEQPSVDNDLPPPSLGGWPGCPGHVDNALPTPPPSVDNSLPPVPPEVWGGAPSSPDNTLPEPPEVWGGAPAAPDNTLPPEAAPKK